MNILLIGDVHGLTQSYYDLLAKHKPEKSIQLGDFGFRAHHQWHRTHLNEARHKVLFGNHDDTSCLTMLHSLGDYGYNKPKSLFWVRGAESIDRAYRVEGRDWWADEELSIVRFNQVITDYERVKPRIMLSHDCPQSVRANLFGIYDSSRTAQALQAMLEIHQPEFWVFGHHHRSINTIYMNVNFVCLNELETTWIEL